MFLWAGEQGGRVGEEGGLGVGDDDFLDRSFELV